MHRQFPGWCVHTSNKNSRWCDIWWWNRKGISCQAEGTKRDWLHQLQIIRNMGITLMESLLLKRCLAGTEVNFKPQQNEWVTLRSQSSQNKDARVALHSNGIHIIAECLLNSIDTFLACRHIRLSNWAITVQREHSREHVKIVCA